MGIALRLTMGGVDEAKRPSFNYWGYGGQALVSPSRYEFCWQIFVACFKKQLTILVRHFSQQCRHWQKWRYDRWIARPWCCGFKVNVRGVLFAMQEAAKRMNNNGRIVWLFLSSTTWFIPWSGMAVYVASSLCPNILLKCFSGERGITVNSAVPGQPDPGDVWSYATRNAIKAAAASSPFGRIDKLEDIADVVARQRKHAGLLTAYRCQRRARFPIFTTNA